MKKLTGILFLSVLLLQVGGSYVYFIVRLSAIRHEMRAQLQHKPDDQLTLLTLTHEEFQKAKADDHEVKVDGKMYDIARVVISGDKVLVYALHDEAEDNLIALLDEIVKRSSNDKKPVPSQLIQLLSLQFVIEENKFPSLTGEPVVHITPYSIYWPVGIASIESPPPRG